MRKELSVIRRILCPGFWSPFEEDNACLVVSQSVMERVSRFTQADIVPSVDSLVSKTAMGFCHTFKTQNFTLPDGNSLVALGCKGG